VRCQTQTRRIWEAREGVRLVVHAVDAVLTVLAALAAATVVVID
jgi:hypothetical protein